jgi:hypothetical protein
VAAVVKLITRTAVNYPGVYYHGKATATLPVIARLLPFFADPLFRSIFFLTYLFFFYSILFLISVIFFPDLVMVFSFKLLVRFYHYFAPVLEILIDSSLLIPCS